MVANSCQRNGVKTSEGVQCICGILVSYDRCSSFDENGHQQLDGKAMDRKLCVLSSLLQYRKVFLLDGMKLESAQEQFVTLVDISTLRNQVRG